MRTADWCDDYVRARSEAVVLLLLPGDVHDSDAWTAMLALAAGKLQSVTGAIFYSIEAYELALLAQREKRHVQIFVIYCDEAIYSGKEQRLALVPLTNEDFHAELKEAAVDDVTEAYAAYGVHMLACVPFYTAEGVDAVTSATYSDVDKFALGEVVEGPEAAVLPVVFPTPPPAVLLHRASESLDATFKGLSKAEQRAVKRQFGYRPTVTCAYFDHGLADEDSTMTNAISYGEVLALDPKTQKLVPQKDVRFVANCPAAMANVTPAERATSVSGGRKRVCPPAFRVEIKLTLDGAPLSGDASTAFAHKKPM